MPGDREGLLFASIQRNLPCPNVRDKGLGAVAGPFKGSEEAAVLGILSCRNEPWSVDLTDRDRGADGPEAVRVGQSGAQLSRMNVDGDCLARSGVEDELTRRQLQIERGTRRQIDGDVGRVVAGRIDLEPGSRGGLVNRTSVARAVRFLSERFSKTWT